MQNKGQHIVHHALGSGRWFPGNRRELEEMVTRFMDQAEVKEVQGRIVGAVAPHAGYIYSGKVAGYVFRAIRDQAKKGYAPDTVVILGISHSDSFPGVALMDGDAFITPLGETPLDKEATDFLASQDSLIRLDYRPHHGEHSAENEVPFVQASLPNVPLVLAIIGDHNENTIKALSEALNKLSQKKKLLVIASSDMLHNPDYELVTRTDKASLKTLASMNVDALLKEWSFSHQTFCGITAVAVATQFAKNQGCQQATVLIYRNSGDDFPESRGQWVVGYGAVVFAVK